MKFRNLRIAFSAGCGLAAVLLLVLWVRSCWTFDKVDIPLWGSWSVSVASFPGTCGVGDDTNIPTNFNWQTYDMDAIRRAASPEELKYYTSIWGRFYHVTGNGVDVPDWFLIGAAVALSAVPWIHWSNQFSLRTLLIATTVVAVVLGLVVWSIKR